MYCFLFQTAAYTSAGLIFGPVAYVWYKYLEIWIPGKELITIAKKLLVDEITWGPLFSASIFYVLPLVETRDHDFAVTEFKNKFLTAWLGSASFWLIFQSINFRYVPQRYRVTYLLGVCLIYDTVLAVYRYQY